MVNRSDEAADHPLDDRRRERIHVRVTPIVCGSAMRRGGILKRSNDLVLVDHAALDQRKRERLADRERGPGNGVVSFPQLMFHDCSRKSSAVPLDRSTHAGRGLCLGYVAAVSGARNVEQ